MPFPPLINVQASEAETTLLGSSWLVYNSVLLTEVLTESYEMEEVRSEDGSQKLATKHTIKVLAIFNPQVNAYVAQTTAAVRSPVQPNITQVRDFLLTDRGFLQYAIGGRVVVESPERTSANETRPCDSYQGPKPLYCQVTNVTGTATFYVRFAVECWTDTCVTVGGLNQYVQSHRWTMTHDVNGDDWSTTRMVTGQIKFRPELLQVLDDDGLATEPDQVNVNFFHPVPYGFKRQNVRVQAHPNGMELSYAFVDQEVVLPLGSLSPATKLTAEFSLAAGFGQDKTPITQAGVHVAALGPKNQYRFNLLVMAMRIGLRKLAKPGLIMINEVQIHYSLDNRFVDLTLKAIWKPVVAGMEGLHLADTGLKATDDYGDLDNALSIFRANGEYPQASRSNLAQSPVSSFDGRCGTYLGLCVGSTLVNGCFQFQQPENLWFSLSNEKATRSAEFEPDPQNLLVDPKTNTGQSIPFSLEITSGLTIALYSTGLSPLATEGAGVYEEWSQSTRYHTSHQKAVLPIGRAVSASPGDDIGVYSQPQVATLGLPYTLKSVDWSVAWIGPNPNSILLPSPDSGDTNDVLLAEDITPAVPMVVNSSHKSWRVSGTYWYVSKRLRSASATVVATFPSLGVDQGFSPGKSITDPNDRQTNTIGQSRFVAGYSPSFVG
jgi:hypothetical protein